MTSINELFEQHYSGDPDGCTDAIMSAVKLSAYQREVLAPALRFWVGTRASQQAQQAQAVALELVDPASSVTHARKARTRRNDAAPLPPHLNLPPTFDITLPQLRALLPVEFVVGGRRMTWGTATINDHRAAEAFHRRVARTHLVTADQHRQTVLVLERSGCDTLGELFQRKAAAA